MNPPQRYDRQIKLLELGPKGQQKLKQARVLIVGVGGLGCPAAQYLVAAGVGHIGLLDHDRIDWTNLHRQILFSENEVGRYKSEVAKEVLSRQNSEVDINAYVTHLGVHNALDMISGYDVVLDGTDNFQTKYLINDACVQLDKPFVGASVYKYQGQLSVFNYQDGPTYRCLYPTHHEEEVQNCEEVGVIGVLPGMMGIMQASETIKLITGIGTVLSGKLKWIDMLSASETLIAFQKNEPAVQEIKNRPLRMEMLTCELKNPQALYLDVREPHEMPIIRQPNVLNIPLSELDLRYAEIPKDRPVHVFCQSGVRSSQAIQWLNATHGYTQLENVEEGVKALMSESTH